MPFGHTTAKLSAVRTVARKAARQIIFPALTGFWTLVFGIAGLIFRPQTRALTAGDGQRVLLLAPHPDDETIGCGGTLALHALAGDEVTVCIVTDGSRSRAGNLKPEEMADVR